MRILHIIDSLGAGGAERSLAELAPRLPDLGIEPMLVVFRRVEQGFHEEVVASGVPVTLVEARGQVSRLRQLRALIRKTQPDLVHTTLFAADVLGRLAALGRAPVLSSLVNTRYGRHRLEDPNVSRHGLAAARLVDAGTAQLVDHFHAITKAVKDSASRDLHVSAERITVIPRGRDPERLGTASPDRRAAARKLLGVSELTPLVLNVARQEYQKGQLHLLDAAAELRQVRPDVRWLIAGRRGNASQDLERRHRELALGDSVRFLGHRDDVPELMCAADAFVFPSLYEGLGGVLLEAMALDVPVVASDIPAVTEVLDGGRTGRLVTPGDRDQLAQAVDRILSDRPAARALARAAQQRFQNHYRFELVTRDLAALFESVAG